MIVNSISSDKSDSNIGCPPPPLPPLTQCPSRRGPPRCSMAPSRHAARPARHAPPRPASWTEPVPLAAPLPRPSNMKHGDSDCIVKMCLRSALFFMYLGSGMRFESTRFRRDNEWVHIEGTRSSPAPSPAASRPLALLALRHIALP